MSIGRAAAHFGARSDEADVADEMRLVRLDVARVLADQVGRDEAVDVAFGGGRTVERLAEARDALVGLDLHPEDVGKLLRADGLDGRDFHDSPVWRGRAGRARQST